MSETIKLPVLALRDTVFFPGVTAPIGVGRPSTLKALQAAVADKDRLIFTVAQKDNVTDVQPEGLYTVGTIARIRQIQRLAGGSQLLLEGTERGVAVRYEEEKGYISAVIRPAVEIEPPTSGDPTVLALVRELRERAGELGQRAGFPSDVVSQVLGSVEEPGKLSDLVSSYLELSTVDKQLLLENLSIEERLRRTLVHVQREIEVLDAQDEVKSRVQQELGDRQREMVLREQMRAIQDELGETDESEEVDELQQRLVELELPPTARKEVDRELKRLGRVNRESMEYQILRSYLEFLAELPWSERSGSEFDLEAAARILDEDHYGLQDVKDRVLEFLAVHQLREQRASAEGEEAHSDRTVDSAVEITAPESTTDDAADSSNEIAATANRRDGAKSPTLLFIGPPGVGKTSIARSIARAMGREYVRISLGGARDEADIRGHRRTYVGAMAGRILKGMKQAGTKNPVFLLDEIDKIGVSYQGDPASALLEVLDPAQNDSFVDHYLGVPFDLSEVLFIATANFIQNIPGPLLDRMEVADFSGYTEQEKMEIARRYLVPRQLEEHALSAQRLQYTDGALAGVISHYTREAGVRQLEREIGRLARKVARKIATHEVETAKIDEDSVRELLGRPKIHPEKAAAKDQVGIVTGMFYTPAGGDIMFVEVSSMRGKGELVLTGQLGDVMKESARAAWSYARSHAVELGIDDEAFDKDLHIHVPAGAIPKDGPSAGVTMATALVSALSGLPARHDVAMTGEITLSGRVLPIGGVKEKVLGAVRAGIETVVLPHENDADLEDLPKEILERLDLVLANDLSEVFEAAFRTAPRPRTGDLRPEELKPTEPSSPGGLAH